MRRALLSVAVAIALSTSARAQSLQPELRVDALGPRTFTIEPGAGVNVALGYYVRVGVAAGFNMRRAGASTGNSWRGDLLTRFTLDPFRQQRWGFSLGGGLSVRRHAYLAAIVDLEGPEIRGFVPALQAGVSGGYRFGVILRRAVKGRR